MAKSKSQSTQTQTVVNEEAPKPVDMAQDQEQNQAPAKDPTEKVGFFKRLGTGLKTGLKKIGSAVKTAATNVKTFVVNHKEQVVGGVVGAAIVAGGAVVLNFLGKGKDDTLSAEEDDVFDAEPWGESSVTELETGYGSGEDSYEEEEE